MHDELYSPQPPCVKSSSGFSDILAIIDESTKRTCPLTQTVHYLVDFCDPKTNKPIPFCCRSLLKSVLSSNVDLVALTGMELEFFNFKETPDTLKQKQGTNLTPLTPGMFGYSLNRPAVYQSYFDDIYDKCNQFGIPIECFHTETGPGVYEAAIEYTGTLQLADRAHLFKILTKKIGLLRIIN
jgi:glutamine synthetase